MCSRVTRAPAEFRGTGCGDVGVTLTVRLVRYPQSSLPPDTMQSRSPWLLAPLVGDDGNRACCGTAHSTLSQNAHVRRYCPQNNSSGLVHPLAYLSTTLDAIALFLVAVFLLIPHLTYYLCNFFLFLPPSPDITQIRGRQAGSPPSSTVCAFIFIARIT